MHHKTAALLLTAAAVACTPAPESPATPRTPASDVGAPVVLSDTALAVPFVANAVAEPFARAQLGTKLMGTVTAVLVREGDRVAAGQVVARVDARELGAKRVQIEATLSAAEAAQREASLMATRMRALFADSAAPKVQLDAAEAQLARADAGVRGARAALDELGAVSDYADVRAPFAGVITQQLADAGTLAAPGVPLLAIEDHSRLRIVATVTPEIARGLARGARLEATVEGTPVVATVEGIVPAPGQSLVMVNAIAENRAGTLAPGGVATLAIPGATRSVLLVPAHAVRTAGDLTGVSVRSAGRNQTRWITLGRTIGGGREVLSGLTAGDTILVAARAESR